MPLFRSKRLARAINRVLAILHCNMLRWCISLAVPYKTLAFFADYFDTIEEIDTERRGDAIGGNDSKKLTIFLMMAVTGLKCLHFGCLYFGPLGPTDRVLLFDFVTQITGRLELNLGMAFVSLMTGYFYQLMYLSNYNQLTRILRDILLHGDGSFFLEPNSRRGGRPLSKVVLRTALLIINGLQCFTLAIDLLIVLTQALLITYLTFNWSHLFANASPLAALLWCLLLELNALLSYAFLYLFGNICILISTVGILQAFLFLLKQKQIVALLWRRPPHQQQKSQFSSNQLSAAVWQPLERFSRLEVVHILLFSRMNDTYGSAFLAFLLINVPMSVRLLSLLMLRQLADLAAVFFVLMYLLHQVSAIFGMHLVAARYSSLIHSPARRLAQLFGRLQQLRQQNQPPIISRLKVAHFIGAFHVRNRYGAYYGKSMGLISMATFAKFLVVYSKLLFSIYTRFHQQSFMS